MPLFEHYRIKAGLQANILSVQLDSVWNVLSGEPSDVEEAATIAEGLVPTDDADWFFEMGYAQNAAAAVSYAAGTWLNDDLQDAVSAARQVYEAADLAAQHVLRGQLGLGGLTDDTLMSHSAVQRAIRGIENDLDSACSFSGNPAILRGQVAASRTNWISTLP